jgi:hypothetical protein
LTAAQLLLRRVATTGNSKKETLAVDSSAKPPAPDIDDEIQRLEAELQADTDSSSSSSSSSDSDDDSDDDRKKLNANLKASGPAVLNLSKVKDERIKPLNASLLPSSKKRTLKIDRDHEQEERPKKKVNAGLEFAVKEILNGYVARSSEKLPFFCRQCAKQYDNEEEFFDHKRSEFHKTAVEMEQKASYCKLCRKQLTSLVQLKEHLTSKPHKERLDRVRENRRMGGNRGRGRGRGPGQERRQWS